MTTIELKPPEPKSDELGTPLAQAEGRVHHILLKAAQDHLGLAENPRQWMTGYLRGIRASLVMLRGIAGMDPSQAAGFAEAAESTFALVQQDDPDAVAYLAALLDGEEDPDPQLLAIERSLPIEELDLSARSYNGLRRDGVRTLGDVADRTREELLDIRWIGKGSVSEIAAKLTARTGLTLKRPSGGRGRAAWTVDGGEPA